MLRVLIHKLQMKEPMLKAYLLKHLVKVLTQRVMALKLVRTLNLHTLVVYMLKLIAIILLLMVIE